MLSHLRESPDGSRRRRRNFPGRGVSSETTWDARGTCLQGARYDLFARYSVREIYEYILYIYICSSQHIRDRFVNMPTLCRMLPSFVPRRDTVRPSRPHAGRTRYTHVLCNTINNGPPRPPACPAPVICRDADSSLSITRLFHASRLKQMRGMIVGVRPPVVDHRRLPSPLRRSSMKKSCEIPDDVRSIYMYIAHRFLIR